MDTITDVRITETERTALTRLLAKAKAEGVKLIKDRDGRHFASSVSQPGTLHYVTGLSCDCRGFVSHGRCKHHAALLAALGWLTGTPEPDPGMTITLAHTDGHYSLAAEPEWIEQDRPIDDLTGCTPASLDHDACVRYWIESLDARIPAYVPMQDAGLMPADEFLDAQPVAA